MRWVDFMMRFELGLEAPDPKRAITSAATIAVAYIAGGMIPLSPYIVLGNAFRGLDSFSDCDPGGLGIFGFIKGKYTGAHALRSAFQTVIIGGLAAAAAFLLAKWIS